MNRILWHGTIKARKYSLLFFLWWGRGAWRWPTIERLCSAGHGYAYSEWRYKIGLFDGKFRRHASSRRGQMKNIPAIGPRSASSH